MARRLAPCECILRRLASMPGPVLGPAAGVVLPLPALPLRPTRPRPLPAQEAVSILSNSSATQAQLQGALQALRYLVEPIDAANGAQAAAQAAACLGCLQRPSANCASVYAMPCALLCSHRVWPARLHRPPCALHLPPTRPFRYAPADLQGMGGLPPLVALLAAGRPTVLQAAAAHALGTAAQNNRQFQAQLLVDHPEVLQLLLALVARAGEPAGAAGAAEDGPTAAAAGQPEAGTGAEVGLKALYALAALLRLDAGARSAFYGAGGVHTLQQLLASPAAGLRAKKKAAALLTDLVHLDAPAMSAAAAATAAQQRRTETQRVGSAATTGPTAGLDLSAVVAAALQLLDVEAWPLQEADLDLQVGRSWPAARAHARAARYSIRTIFAGAVQT